jgi:hypothetical protein
MAEFGQTADQRRSLAGFAAGGHPVGRKLDAGQLKTKVLNGLKYPFIG